ncbi:MAG: phosphoglycerol transferase [Mucilaginibacter sp.]|nr:phosphoglycerol transferase [Mucilaginibacter sp.]
MKKKEVKQASLREKLTRAAASFSALAIIWLAVILVLTLFELIYNGVVHQFPPNFAGTIFWSWLNDVVFWLKWLVYFFVIYALLYLISRKAAAITFSILIVVMALLQLGLALYFTTSLVPLGADLYSYSVGDIKQTVGSSGGISIFNILIFILLLVSVFAALYVLPKRIRLNRYAAFAIPLLSLLVILTGLLSKSFVPDLRSDFANNLVLNKPDYFWAASQKHFFSGKDETDIYADSYISDYGSSDNKTIAGLKYTDPEHYPFLHADSVPDVLSPFFKASSTQPNVVIILVEGLGRAFTNSGAYLGNFTPFIDSLSGKSLYWKNFLSEGGRTFAVLPSLLGSLPFAKNGFEELGQGMPEHLSLLSLLKYNGYHTSFYYGGDSQFDNMATFLHKNGIDELNDEKSFPAGYAKLPAQNGFTWGYNDGELFRHFLATRSDKPAAPQLNVVLTVATHDPFIINDQQKYLLRFEQRMTQLGFDDNKKSEHRNYKLQYASILYLDDMLRGFFNNYSKRSDYSNTIFLITGDHRMPEIPMSDKIDRYHVPLIIYSPMLKKPAQFASVSTHFDISPSLLAYLHHNFKTKGPSLVSWLGQGLDTTRSFQNIHAYPLMQTKTDLVDFVMGEYHLNGENLFKLNPELGEDPIQDEAKLNQLKNAFDQFRKKNTMIMSGNHIIPDTIYHRYTRTK